MDTLEKFMSSSLSRFTLKIIDGNAGDTIKVLPSHIRAYVAAGNDIDLIQPTIGMTLLNYFITQEPNLRNVETIIRLSADIEQKCEKGYTPLWHGLLNMGIKNVEGLHDELTQEGERYRICKFLVKVGANVNLFLPNGNSMLMTCTHRPISIESTRFLLASGVDIRVTHRDTASVLHDALRGTTSAEVMLALVQAGASLDAVHFDYPPLLYSIHCDCNIDMIKVFIETGADVNYRRKDGITALLWALKKGMNIEIIQLLIDAGAYVNVVDDRDWDVLRYAIYNNGSTDKIKLLLKHGADINHISDEDGPKTTLGVLKHLIRNGNVDRSYYKEMLWFLKRNGAKS